MGKTRGEDLPSCGVLCINRGTYIYHTHKIYICENPFCLCLRARKKKKKACQALSALYSYAGYIGCHLCRTTLLLPSQTRAIDLWRLAAKCQCSAK